MNKKNNELLKYITIGFFVVAIFIVPIITLSTPDNKINEVENKILTQFPELSFDSVESKRFMKNFDKYTSDQFPFRTNFIEIKNIYSYALGNREFRDIYINKNGRLMEKFIIDKNIIDKNISQATNISNYIYNNYNINSKLMLIPTSISFYGDSLPYWCYSDNQENIINSIDKIISTTSSSLNFYSPYKALDKNKDKYIYFNTDHHWTQLGAKIAYDDMYNSNSNNLSYDKVSSDFLGTYYSKAILPKIKSDDIYAYKDFSNFKISIDFNEKFNTLYDSSKLKGKNKYQYFLHGDPAFAVIDGNINSTNEILIFKDSYAHSFIPFLTNDYKKIHIIDPRYYTLDIDNYLSKNKSINEVLFINNIQSFNSIDLYNKLLSAKP
ncbi:MAG: DHHW family protein [Romboutsia sp.]